MRYSPEGKREVNLWVNETGWWNLGEKPMIQGNWRRVRIEINDFLEMDEVMELTRDIVARAPRIGGLINFAAWRWWQECLKENEETP